MKKEICVIGCIFLSFNLQSQNDSKWWMTKENWFRDGNFEIVNETTNVSSCLDSNLYNISSQIEWMYLEFVLKPIISDFIDQCPHSTFISKLKKRVPTVFNHQHILRSPFNWITKFHRDTNWYFPDYCRGNIYNYS